MRMELNNANNQEKQADAGKGSSTEPIELLSKTIRIQSENGGLVDLLFKVTVQSTPVVVVADVEPLDSGVHHNDNDNRIDHPEAEVGGQVVVEHEEEEVDPSPSQYFDIEEYLNPTATALRNALVVHNIAQYLSFTDLLKLRGVTKSWNTALLPLIKKRGKTVTIHNANLNEFLSVINNAKEELLPFAIYDIRERDRSPMDGNNLSILFTKYGKLMTHLTLSASMSVFSSSLFRTMVTNTAGLRHLTVFDTDSRFVDANTSNPFWVDWTTSQDQEPLPLLNKLNELHVNLCDSGAEESQAFFTDLFYAVPNLEFLQIGHMGMNSQRNHWSSMVSLKSSRSPSNKIKWLDLQYLPAKAATALIDLAKNHQLALNGLDIAWFIPPDSNSEKDEDNNVKLLEEFLTLQADSLKKLKIVILYKESELVIQLGNMKTLEKFTAHYSLHGVTFESSHETRFPQLKKLRFVNNINDLFDMRIMEHQALRLNKWNSLTQYLSPILTLQELSIDFILHTSDQMIQLHNLCPNIIDLDIIIKDAALITHIYTLWPKLQALKIYTFGSPDGENVFNHDDDEGEDMNDDGLLDEILTGIPKAFHKLLCAFAPTNPSLVLDQLKTKIGISDMKCLSKLTLCLDSHFINDVSGYYGFGLPNTKLKYVGVSLNCSKISDLCKQDIQNCLGADAKIDLELEYDLDKCVHTVD